MVLEKPFHFKVSRGPFRTLSNIFDGACVESCWLFSLATSFDHALNKPLVGVGMGSINGTGKRVRSSQKI